jgi:hypothetical protein
MRPVRIILVVIALIAVGLAGWALGSRGGYGQPGADPAIAEAPSAPDDQATQDRVAGGGNAPSVNAPSGGGSAGGGGPSGGTKPTPTTKPTPPKAAPKPSFEGLGTIPDSPHIGTALHLPPAPGEVIFVLDIANATRAQFWLAPTGTAVSNKARWLGEDRNGRNGWTARWSYTEEVPLAHLVVRATGPGGTTEEFFPLTNNGGMDPTEEVAEEVSEDQQP